MYLLMKVFCVFIFYDEDLVFRAFKLVLVNLFIFLSEQIIKYLNMDNISLEIYY